MPKNLFLSLFAVGILPFTSALLAQEKVDKHDVLARETADQFIKVIKSDIEAVMKMVDVPFCFPRENIKDRETLRTKLESLVRRNQESKANVECKVQAIYSFANLEKKLKLPERDHKLLKEVLEKTDRVVIYTLITNPPRDDRAAVFVRIREGKAKVVGIR